MSATNDPLNMASSRSGGDKQIADNDSPRRPMLQQHRVASKKSGLHLAAVIKIRKQCRPSLPIGQEWPALAPVFRLLLVVAAVVAVLKPVHAEDLSDTDRSAG